MKNEKNIDKSINSLYNGIIMDDGELLQKCADKDLGAWNTLVKRYGSVVLRSVKYKLQKMGVRLPGSELCDVVQDIFTLIWESFFPTSKTQPSQVLDV